MWGREMYGIGRELSDTKDVAVETSNGDSNGEGKLPVHPGLHLSKDELVETYDESDYLQLRDRLQCLHPITVETGDGFDHGIKAIIRGHEFVHSSSLSSPTRIFMLLHTLGHYQFLTSAARMGIDRYDYIYEVSDDRSAHVYNYSSADIGRPVDQAMIDDRIEFEVRANDFAVEIAKAIAMPKLVPLIRLFEPADIRYIVDVMRGGPSAIRSDEEYLSAYVLSGLALRRPENTERIFDRGTFGVANIDWDLIASRKIEIHFL